MKPKMPVGTRSLLFGAHQFVLHPLFVALAWRKLYGSFPRQWPIWIAFLIHDWEYWGMPNMDGPEGEHHPELGARLVGALFDHRVFSIHAGDWYRFTAGHSRYYASLIGIRTSPLMRADKLATAIMPFWLYVGLCACSGEWREYVAKHIADGYTGAPTLLAWAKHLRADWRERYGTTARVEMRINQ